MSETSSSSSLVRVIVDRNFVNRNRRKVPARHFMDIPMEEPQPKKRAAFMRILAAVGISAVIMGILAAVYHCHQEEEALPEAKNFVRQRMSDVEGLCASVWKDYIAGFFTNKKYVLQVTPERTPFMGLFKWKKIKKFNVKIADL